MGVHGETQNRFSSTNHDTSPLYVTEPLIYGR